MKTPVFPWQRSASRHEEEEACRRFPKEESDRRGGAAPQGDTLTAESVVEHVLGKEAPKLQDRRWSGFGPMPSCAIPLCHHVHSAAAPKHDASRNQLAEACLMLIQLAVESQLWPGDLSSGFLFVQKGSACLVLRCSRRKVMCPPQLQRPEWC